MTHSATLPFFFKRGEDAMSGATVTTTTETVHGLLRLDGDSLTIQWRLARRTERVGWSIHTEREVEPAKGNAASQVSVRPDLGCAACAGLPDASLHRGPGEVSSRTAREVAIV